VTRCRRNKLELTNFLCSEIPLIVIIVFSAENFANTKLHPKMPLRTVSIRPSALRTLPRYASFAPRLNPTLIRGFNSKDTPPLAPSKPVGPNQDPPPHASKEAADIIGGVSPDLEQGTPIGEARF